MDRCPVSFPRRHLQDRPAAMEAPPLHHDTGTINSFALTHSLTELHPRAFLVFFFFFFKLNSPVWTFPLAEQSFRRKHQRLEVLRPVWWGIKKPTWWGNFQLLPDSLWKWGPVLNRPTDSAWTGCCGSGLPAPSVLCESFRSARRPRCRDTRVESSASDPTRSMVSQ